MRYLLLRYLAHCKYKKWVPSRSPTKYAEYSAELAFGNAEQKSECAWYAVQVNMFDGLLSQHNVCWPVIPIHFIPIFYLGKLSASLTTRFIFHQFFAALPAPALPAPALPAPALPAPALHTDIK